MGKSHCTSTSSTPIPRTLLGRNSIQNVILGGDRYGNVHNSLVTAAISMSGKGHGQWTEYNNTTFHFSLTPPSTSLSSTSSPSSSSSPLHCLASLSILTPDLPLLLKTPTTSSETPSSKYLEKKHSRCQRLPTLHTPRLEPAANLNAQLIYHVCYQKIHDLHMLCSIRWIYPLPSILVSKCSPRHRANQETNKNKLHR